jgi:hypothetical protein
MTRNARRRPAARAAGRPAPGTAPPAVLPPDAAADGTFARVASAGSRVAFVAVSLAFVLYISGWLPALVPVAVVEREFHRDAADFVRVTGAPAGWSWLGRLGHGDALSLAGMVLLVAVVAAAFLSLLPGYLRRRDWLYAALVAAQLAVFAGAMLAR